MKLCDEQGEVLARIYISEEQVVDEETAPGGAYEGYTRTTDEVHEHLRQLCNSYIPTGRGYRVEWLPQAVEHLEQVWRDGNPPPPPHRQHAAQMKFIQDLVDLVDRKLRAWTTLTRKWRDRQYVLIQGPLVVLFRVHPDRSLVSVEQVWRDDE